MPSAPLDSDWLDHLVKHAQSDVLEPALGWVLALTKILWRSMTALPDPKAGPDQIGDFLALWGVVGSAALLVLSVLVSILPSKDEKRQARVDVILEAAVLTAGRVLAAEKARVDADAALVAATGEYATADQAHVDAANARDLATRVAHSACDNAHVVAGNKASAFFAEQARVLADEAFSAANQARVDAAKALDLANRRARSAGAATTQVTPAHKALAVAAEEARLAAQDSRRRADLARITAEKSRVLAEQAISATIGAER